VTASPIDVSVAGSLGFVAGWLTMRAPWCGRWVAAFRMAAEAVVDDLCRVCLAETDLIRQRALMVFGLTMLRGSMQVARVVALFAAPSAALMFVGVGYGVLAVFSVAYAIGMVLVLRGADFFPRMASPSGSRPSSAFTIPQRLLHVLALQTKAVPRASFVFARFLYYRRAARVTEPNPVFVTGMPRSGTTALTQALHATGCYASLSYRDMPFVMAPNAWGALVGSHGRVQPKRGRVHDDGLTVDEFSPEAFEEVFWASKIPRYESQRGDWISYPPTLIDDFCDFMRMVVSSERGGLDSRPTRYLSKNNNNILRIGLLRSIRGASVIIPFREPVATAVSLLRQHTRMSSIQESDPFTRCYMRWLQHGEFGLDHVPLLRIVSPVGAGSDIKSLEYWILYWIVVHRHLLSSVGANCVFVPHSYALERPIECLSRLQALLAHEAVDPVTVVDNPGILDDAVKNAATLIAPATLVMANELYKEILMHPRCLYAATTVDC
jgi:hypothetical protein